MPVLDDRSDLRVVADEGNDEREQCTGDEQEIRSVVRRRGKRKAAERRPDRSRDDPVGAAEQKAQPKKAREEGARGGRERRGSDAAVARQPVDRAAREQHRRDGRERQAGRHPIVPGQRACRRRHRERRLDEVGEAAEGERLVAEDPRDVQADGAAGRPAGQARLPGELGREREGQRDTGDERGRARDAAPSLDPCQAVPGRAADRPSSCRRIVHRSQ